MNIIIIQSNVSCSRHDIAKQIAYLTSNNKLTFLNGYTNYNWKCNTNSYKYIRMAFVAFISYKQTRVAGTFNG